MTVVSKGRLQAQGRREGTQLGRSASVARAAFVFLLFWQLLKMCAAYCEQPGEIFVLTNG